LAWQEIAEVPIPAEITNMQTQNSDNTTKAMALKISRYVSIFGILPTIFSIIASSVEHIDSLRPHGVMAFVMATYGILIPFIIIISNKKLRKFAGNLKITQFFR
jgi:hypothetical protein